MCSRVMSSDAGSRCSTKISAICFACMISTFSICYSDNEPEQASEKRFPELPKKISNNLNALLALADNAFSEMDLVNVEEDYRTFQKLLSELCGQVDDEIAKKVSDFDGRCIEACIIAMARDRMADITHSSSECYDEIVKEYGSWHSENPRFQPRVLTPQELKEKHKTEKYRLTWESLLLSPECKKLRFMNRRIFEALSAIGNNKSIPVLVYSFRSASKKQALPGTRAFERQHQIIRTLSHFRSEQGLRAILDCLSMEKKNTALPDSDSLRELVFQFLVDPDNAGVSDIGKMRMKNVEEWRKIIEQFPKEKLPLEDRDLLNRIATYKRDQPLPVQKPNAVQKADNPLPVQKPSAEQKSDIFPLNKN